jgi:hypothetical protein
MVAVEVEEVVQLGHVEMGSETTPDASASSKASGQADGATNCGMRRGEPLGASLVGERASWGMATRAVFLALDTEQHVPALLLAKCLPRVETLRQKMTAFWRHSGFGPRFTAFSLLRRCLLLASAALLSCRCRLVSVFGPGPDISGKREWDAPGYLG